MAYDKKNYSHIIKEYEVLQNAQKKELDHRKQEVYGKIPRIEEIDRALHTTGLKLTRKVLDKNADSKEIIEQIRQQNIDLNIEKGELLATHNYPVDYLTVRHQCSKCKDTGYIDGTMCQCFKQKLIKAAYAQSNLDAVLDTQNFDHFDFSFYAVDVDKKEGISPRENIQKIFEQCVYFANHFDQTNQNLLLYGGTGLGKTFLSSCIAKDLLDKEKTVFYQSAFKIFGLLENYQFNRGDQNVNKEQMDRLFDVDLLIIDDLGTEFINTYTNPAFFNILNSRIIDNRKTIINTNLNIQELVNLYSERVISRIIGHYLLLKFFGEDIRKIKMAR